MDASSANRQRMDPLSGSHTAPTPSSANRQRMDASSFDQFFDHALSLNVLTQAELDRITDAVAAGSTTEEAAIEAWLPRTRDAVWPFYKSVTWDLPAEDLRFSVGDQVQANVDEWVPATVVALWYREPSWPVAWVAAYQMKLHGDGKLIYAPYDGNYFVIGAGERPPRRGKVDKAAVLGYGSKSSMRDWEEKGYSPLHVCSMWRGDAKSLKRLLRRPLDECQPDCNDNGRRESPLCMATCYGQLHCAILLLAAGADPRLRNCYGKSAVAIAEETGLRPIFGTTKWAAQALTALLKQRAEELDAEDAEEAGSVIPPGYS